MRLLGALLLVLIAAWPQTAASQSGPEEAIPSGPPMPFVDWGACPFEGCRYDVNWTALKDIRVFEEPLLPSIFHTNPGKASFTIRPGEKVLAMDGVVFFHAPGRARIDHAMDARVHQPNFPALQEAVGLKPGDLLYVLTYRGAGQATVWFDGRLLDVDFTCVGDAGICTGGTTDMGGILDFGHNEWWVKVRNARGQIGWTDRTDDFSGGR